MARIIDLYPCLDGVWRPLPFEDIERNEQPEESKGETRKKVAKEFSGLFNESFYEILNEALEEEMKRHTSLYNFFCRD